MSTEEAQRAVDLWHDDPADGRATGVLRRQQIRADWPELGRALDGAQPSEILAAIHPVVTDSELVDTARQLEEEYSQPTDSPRILINWPACVTVVVSLLVGIACGMAIEFSVLTPGI